MTSESKALTKRIIAIEGGNLDNRRLIAALIDSILKDLKVDHVYVGTVMKPREMLTTVREEIHLD